MLCALSVCSACARRCLARSAALRPASLCRVWVVHRPARSPTSAVIIPCSPCPPVIPCVKKNHRIMIRTRTPLVSRARSRVPFSCCVMLACIALYPRLGLSRDSVSDALLSHCVFQSCLLVFSPKHPRGKNRHSQVAPCSSISPRNMQLYPVLHQKCNAQLSGIFINHQPRGSTSYPTVATRASAYMNL